MNPTTQPEAESPGKWGRLAWLPIPMLLVAIIAARMAGLRETYESHTLLLVLSFTFYTLVSLGTLYLIGRSFLALGSPGLLLLECGVVLWSLAGTVGDFVSHGDANINVTIFNIGILLAGLCHLAGAILALSPQRVLRVRPVWLGAGCAFALGALWLVSQAALAGWLPAFFIPGHGGTLVRYCVLISAIAMFLLSAGVLHANQRAARLPFTSWYALALLLLAVGLFGIMIQLSLGSLVNWLSRAAQWLGGLYLLFAAIASLRESHLPLLPLERKLHPAYYREAIAVAVVLAAAAIRLAFLSAMGTHSPFLVFFPAVMLAAIYGGLRAGLLATALSAIFVDYFWIEPAGQFTIGQPSDWLSIMIFLMSGAMIAGVSEAMHRARTRAFAAETQALLAAEREKTAEALHEGRARLEAALASMTDAVFISDVQGHFIDFNDAFATFHRFKSKGDCAKTLAEYPDILDVFMADGTLAPLDMWAVPRALRGETVTNAEYTLRRKDTNETWVGSYSFGPIRDKDGAIVGSVVVGRDITDLKRAEEDLRRQREWLRVTLGSIGDGVIASDTEGRIVFLNPVAVTLTGWQHEETLGQPIKSIFRIINEKTHAPAEDLVARVLNEKRAVALANDTALVTKDGREVPIEDSAAPIKDSAGNLIGVVLVFHDVTEKRRAQEALRQAHERAVWLARFPEQNPNPIIRASVEGIVLYCNPASAKLHGWTCEVGQPLQNELLPLVGRAMAEGTEVQEDVQLAGRFYVVWIAPFPMEGYANVYGRDITERKGAEEALRLSEEKFALAFDSNPAAIAMTRLEDGLFLEVNDTWATLTGYSREEAIGHSAREMHIWPTTEASSRFARELQEKGSLRGWEQEFLKKSGEVFVAQLSAQALTLRGEKVILSTIVDITERKRAEEALQTTLQRLHTLVASMHNSVLLVDDDGRIAFANQAFCDYFNLRDSLADLVGITSNEMIEKIKNAYLRSDEEVARIGEIVRQGQSVTGEEIAMRDGRSCLRDFVPIYRDGRSYGRLWQHTDITERKRAEEALRKAHGALEVRVQERTFELSEAVERLRAENIQRKLLEDTLRESEKQVRFFASQCLTAQETERKRVAGELHDSISASLGAMKFRIDKIAEEMKQGHSITESLQDLGSNVTEINNEARRIMADLRPSILDDLGIIAATNWFCREYQKTYSHISVDNQIGISEDEVPDSLKTQIFRISQEAMNNIAKHSQASLVNLSLRKDDDKIILAIQDNGKGFDLDTTKRGMGLSTMRERAELSGGSFDLESAIGKGTHIRVSWPLVLG